MGDSRVPLQRSGSAPPSFEGALAALAFAIAVAACSGGTLTADAGLDGAPASEVSSDGSPTGPDAKAYSADDASSTDSTIADPADASSLDAPSTNVPSVDTAAYCAAESAFIAQCAADASPACTGPFSSYCPALAANLSGSLQAAAVSCQGHFDCKHDVIRAATRVDVLTHARIAQRSVAALGRLGRASSTNSPRSVAVMTASSRLTTRSHRRGRKCWRPHPRRHRAEPGSSSGCLAWHGSNRSPSTTP